MDIFPDITEDLLNTILGNVNYYEGPEKIIKSHIIPGGKDYMTGKEMQTDRVRFRNLLCCWAMVELGMPVVDVGRKFGMTPAAVGYTVQRVEKMAKEGVTNWKLELFEYLRSCPFSLLLFDLDLIGIDVDFDVIGAEWTLEMILMVGLVIGGL